MPAPAAPPGPAGSGPVPGSSGPVPGSSGPVPGSSGPGPVVIVGAGPAGAGVATELRERGYGGPITLVGKEGVPPYQRPPLSKGYLTGTTSPGELPIRPAAWYGERGIDLLTDDPARALDPHRQRVTLHSGRELPYGRLVLATGARPRPLAVPGATLPGVLSLRSLADADALAAALRPGGRDLLVIGGGFVGLEVAAAAHALGWRVTVVEAGQRLLARSVSPRLSAHLAAVHQAHGVRVLTGREVVALCDTGSGRVGAFELAGGERYAADVVVAGIGVLPETRLAADAGLSVGDGVLVDALLRTSDRAVYALGDCARFPNHSAGRMTRLESVQNAADQARCVAAGLCGEPEPYRAVPWFWTEQYGLRVQIAGLTTGHDQTLVHGDVAGGRFSVFCFRAGRLVGTESVNRTADHMITRRLLASGAPGPRPEDVARPDFDLRTHQHLAV
ncbi:FAD-dependent oxidoreductase [Streptomyces sp. JJ66]|uniref:NAD(P)/FAD-dependent oxidoreductase n=1 Tax=Streptomyces sp. JJ66 TaxID=2803843 RepID=UPI001C596482|nr:FAD-dependent oxidoreductase [Streptomyces sp. JJ66]MBW1602510.1 FAD-dependent oxidoreductase [Streptomyces sp. JJ66]